jgi:hypothetical protein
MADYWLLYNHQHRRASLHPSARDAWYFATHTARLCRRAGLPAGDLTATQLINGVMVRSRFWDVTT